MRRKSLGEQSIQILTHHLNSYLNCMKCLTLALNKTFISEMDGNDLGAWCKEPEPVGCSSVLSVYTLVRDSLPFHFCSFLKCEYGAEYIYCILAYMCLRCIYPFEYEPYIYNTSVLNSKIIHALCRILSVNIPQMAQCTMI